MHKLTGSGWANFVSIFKPIRRAKRKAHTFRRLSSEFLESRELPAFLPLVVNSRTDARGNWNLAPALNEPLLKGFDYVLEARGAPYIAADQRKADAQFYQKKTGSTTTWTDLGPSGGLRLGNVGVEGRWSTLATPNSTHTYRILVHGNGLKLRAFFMDNNYVDNNGSFTVTVQMVVKQAELSVDAIGTAFEEGNKSGKIRITRNLGNSDFPLSVSYKLAADSSDGAAEFGTNFGSSELNRVQTVVFRPGQTVIDLLISPKDDDSEEYGEKVSLALELSTDYTVPYDPTAFMTIVDNDSLLKTFWQKQGTDDTTWKAIKDGANLKQLAKIITNDENDWTCIWPSAAVGQAALWQNYPTAKVGALASIENLVETRGTSLFLLEKEPSGGDPAIVAGKGFMIQNGWKDPKEYIHDDTNDSLAKNIRNQASNGGAPIGLMYVMGHFGVPGPEFATAIIDKLETVSDPATRNNTNTYATASRQIGPVRSWFTRNARVAFLGCVCNGVAEQLAANILRDDAKAYGNSHFVLANRNSSNALFQMGIDIDDNQRPSGGDRFSFTLEGLALLPDWLMFSGGK